MGNLALQFAFRYADTHSYGYNQREALTKVAEEFKRSITAIAIRRRSDNEKSHRRYYFNDNTVLIFQNGEFQLCRRIN